MSGGYEERRVNIYVGNLSYTATDEDLRSAFEGFGQIASARVIMDKETGRSKGFGFVEMSDDTSADVAIEKAHGYEMGGRALNVSEARPQAPRESRNFNQRSSGGRSFGAPRANSNPRY